MARPSAAARPGGTAINLAGAGLPGDQHAEFTVVSTRADHPLTPAEAVDRLEALHGAAADAVRAALERFVSIGVPPTADERARFRYPELKVVWEPSGPSPTTRRAWAKFQAPGVYATTVTQPAFFRRYLLQQLSLLAEEYGATITVGPS